MSEHNEEEDGDDEEEDEDEEEYEDGGEEANADLEWSSDDEEALLDVSLLPVQRSLLCTFPEEVPYKNGLETSKEDLLAHVVDVQVRQKDSRRKKKRWKPHKKEDG